MSSRPAFGSMEEYFASARPEVRGILEEIRGIIERTVPGAEAAISYGMPAFRTDHVFIYFAGFKKHIGIYPPVVGDDSLSTALLPYRGEKGNLKFPLDQPMPYDLIERVVRALAPRNKDR